MGYIRPGYNGSKVPYWATCAAVVVCLSAALPFSRAGAVNGVDFGSDASSAQATTPNQKTATGSLVGGLPNVWINMEQTSVSGISAGGFFAVQMHVAFSNTFKGVGVLAGGPFYCAMDNVALALTNCMSAGSNIDVDVLVQITKNTALWEFIDNPINMKDDRVWVLSARDDSVVEKAVVAKLEEYYLNYLADPTYQLKAMYDVNGEHSQLTNFYGSPCKHLGTPYINNCNYDAAGALLQHIYNHTLTKPSTHLFYGRVYNFSQEAFLDNIIPAASVGLNPTGFVYVPKQCEGGKRQCKLHVALHGCMMTERLIGLQYVHYGGYNAWADANDFVILYPQAHTNILNPKGCFDWWGYSGPAYASNVGTQTLSVKRMVDVLQHQPMTGNHSANFPAGGLQSL